MRDSISLGVGFSPVDRAEHNLRVARLAKELSKQVNVVVAVIAPLDDVRKAISRDMDVTWVYVKRTLPQREGHFYEEPKFVITLDHDDLSVEQSYNRLRRRLNIGSKPAYSLFIGRWQPLHEGHLALFDKVRSEGKHIAVGIRDTEVSDDNPYTMEERKDMFKTLVPDAKVFAMPDIEEVVYGRRVGWGIRELRLDDVTESISATKIREAANA
jgi:adenylylsulfate kinase